MLESGAVRLEEVRDLEPARARGGQPREVPRRVEVPRGAGARRVGEVEVEAEGAEAREGGQDLCDVFLWRETCSVLVLRIIMGTRRVRGDCART